MWGESMNEIYRENRFIIPQEKRTGKLAPLRDTLEKMLVVDFYEVIEPDQDGQPDPEMGNNAADRKQRKGEFTEPHSK
jgi:hypothetical protein